jgi:hypothetical protein
MVAWLIMPWLNNDVVDSDVLDGDVANDGMVMWFMVANCGR